MLGARIAQGAPAVARKFSGQRLREHRLAAGLKPEQLALLIDRSVWTYFEYERGKTMPAVSTLGAIADQLGCSVDDLYVREAAVPDAA